MSTTTPELPQPADDELVTQILARRRRRTPLLTLALVVAVAAAAAFVGGAEAQKHFGSSPSSSSSSASGKGAAALRAAIAARFGGAGAGSALAARGGGGAFGRFAGGGVTAGTVTLIRGNRLYVTEASGNTVIVEVGAGANVTKSESGSIRSIRPGDSVTVLGTQQKNGRYTARTVSIRSGGGNG